MPSAVADNIGSLNAYLAAQQLECSGVALTNRTLDTAVGAAQNRTYRGPGCAGNFFCIIIRTGGRASRIIIIAVVGAQPIVKVLDLVICTAVYAGTLDNLSHLVIQLSFQALTCAQGGKACTEQRLQINCQPRAISDPAHGAVAIGIEHIRAIHIQAAVNHPAAVDCQCSYLAVGIVVWNGQCYAQISEAGLIVVKDSTAGTLQDICLVSVVHFLHGWTNNHLGAVAACLIPQIA